MPKVKAKASSGTKTSLPKAYPPPLPPPPPPMDNPYYQKFFREYWTKYGAGFQAAALPGGGDTNNNKVPAIPPLPLSTQSTQK